MSALRSGQLTASEMSAVVGERNPTLIPETMLDMRDELLDFGLVSTPQTFCTS